MTHKSTDQKAHAHGADHVGHHVPMWVLVATLLSLLVLTYLTVAATFVNLGSWNIWIALGIATIKGTLVALFFMHLAYDRPISAIVLISALLFVMLFCGFSLLDSAEYRQNVAEYWNDPNRSYAPLLHTGS